MTSATKGAMERAFCVSPRGWDAWSGRFSDPLPDGSDGPFATLERAREAVRKATPKAGTVVWLRGGRYERSESLTLGEADSGTAAEPILWRAWPGEEVRLVGGREVKDLQPVKDPAVLKRLSPPARGKVLWADLRAQGFTDLGRLASRGFGRPVVPAHMELFFDGRPMKLARWPNEGYVRIAACAAAADAGDGHGGQLGRLEAGFLYEGDRPRTWQDLTDIWLYGYWAWDWAATYERVESVDLDRRLIRTAPPHGQYGFRAGQRYCFLNVLEELDEPGEYYVDRAAGRLYFWPPGAGQAVVSVLESPLLALEGASHVTVRGLTLECSRGSGVVMDGGQGVRIAGCTLRNLGTCGVEVRGGREHQILACDIHDVGDTGIELAGGEVPTLTPGGHQAVNNHIYRFGRWCPCYRPGIHVHGVGQHVAHNRIHDAAHTAILYHGNDHVIEFNEIYRVTMDTGDCGAIYAGRSWIQRGTIIRHNFIHHTGGVGMGSMGVYLDDQLCGQTVVGNVFWDLTRAVMIGGGRDVRVENNFFLDCRPAVHVDGRGMVGGPVWGAQVAKLKEEIRRHADLMPLYRRRYPELASLDKYVNSDALVPPENNTIDRNVAAGGQWIDIRWGTDPNKVPLGRNLVEPEPQSFDLSRGQVRLTKESPAREIGVEDIPFDRIGLQRDEYRPAVDNVRAAFRTGAPGRPGEVTAILSIHNLGDRRQAGAYRLSLEPAGAARLAARAEHAFDLAPGDASTVELTISDARKRFALSAVSDSPHASPASITIAPEPYALPRLATPPTPQAVAGALADAHPWQVLLGRTEIAVVRIGLAGDPTQRVPRLREQPCSSPAGDRLILHVRVHDARPTRPADFWQGSCVEVFGAAKVGGEIGQVVLLPPAEPAAEEARVYRQAKMTAPSKAACAWRSYKDGYELSALIPLEELAIGLAADRFLIEIAVGVAAGPAGAGRATLFGDPNAFENNQGYQDVVVKGSPPR